MNKELKWIRYFIYKNDSDNDKYFLKKKISNFKLKFTSAAAAALTITTTNQTNIAVPQIIIIIIICFVFMI